MPSSKVRRGIFMLLAAGFVIAIGSWQFAPRFSQPATEVSEAELAAHVGSRITTNGILCLHYKLGPLVEIGNETLLLSSDPAGVIDGQQVLVSGDLGQRTFPEPGSDLSTFMAGPSAGTFFTLSRETVTPMKR